jgi:hypothetical protein
MGKKNAQQLLEAAQNYRNMCAEGGDPQLIAALMLLADEFTREAESLDTRENCNRIGGPQAS